MRAGLSSVEILIASAVLVAAFLPIYSAIRGAHVNTALNEHHILARRRARRVLAHVTAHPFQDVRERATGDAPPSGIPGLPEEGSEIRFKLLSGDEEEIQLASELNNMPFGMLEQYKEKIDLMEVHSYFYEFPDEPGLARISVHVSWKDPGSGRAPDRHFVALRFLEDPFHWRRQ